MTYEVIKKNYDRKLWNANMVAIAAAKGVITSEQYKEITGLDYAEPTNIPKSTTQTVSEHEQFINELAGV